MDGHIGTSQMLRLKTSSLQTRMDERILQPEGENPCGVADLTSELDIKTSYELVVCKDVLPYIPQTLENKAIKNLTRLSSRFILLSWNIPNELDPLYTGI